MPNNFLSLEDVDGGSDTQVLQVTEKLNWIVRSHYN